MKPEHKAYWDSLRALALPGVKEAASGGPALKAHGKAMGLVEPTRGRTIVQGPVRRA
jgi:hypothetical protein